MTSSAGQGRDWVIPEFFTNPVIRPYLRNVLSWQCYIRFLGLPDRRDNPDIDIERLFISPMMTPRYVSPDENPENWFDEAETLADTLAENTPLVLLGDPGIGKSTFLNMVAWLLSRPATNPLIERLGWRLPLPMVLRELPIRGVTDFHGLLEAFLSREMSAPLRDDEGRRYLRRTLAEGRAFLLLDGIDEIGDRRAREDLRAAVLDGFARFPDCRWLLSSRIVGYDEVPFDAQRARPDSERSRFGRGSEVREEVAPPYRRERPPAMRRARDDRVATRYIAPFDDSRVAAFARAWYRLRDAAQQRARANANHLIRAVHADDSILRLARVPNLLTMMALIHRIEATLPHGRALLYDRIAEAYLESIDKFRGIDSSPHDLPRKKSWLARVGFEMQRRRTSEDRTDSSEIMVDYETVLGWLSEEMDRGDALPNAPSAERFLNIVGRRSGLFLPRGEGRYAFIHLSFQEYFAAVALAREVTRLRWARGKASRLGFDHRTVARWAGESVWRETFAFLFELLTSEEEDDWHADLLDCVFGEDFSRLDGSESDEVSLNLGRLLARLVVNSRSGLSHRRRDEAIACCVKAQFRLQNWRKGGIVPSSIFSDLIRDDAQLNVRVFARIGAQMDLEEPESREINLSGSQVSDLGSLRNMTALEWLHLRDTQVSDIRPLARLTALEWLDLRGTQVSDIRPLARLTALEWLDLMGTPLSNIGPLAKLTALTDLNLIRTQVSDITPLAKLTALESLALAFTQVSNIRPLAKLTTLEYLDLTDTEVSDIGPLARLNTLEYLDLTFTPVSDIVSLSKLTTLEHLHLAFTQISDITPLAELTSLENLDLAGTQVSDIDPLVELAALGRIVLSDTKVSMGAVEELRISRPDLDIIV